MTKKTNLPAFLLEHNPWETKCNPIWLETSFLLHRNLAKSHFPPKMNEHEFEQTLSLIKKKLLQCSLLKNPIDLNIEGLSVLDKEFLCEHFFRSDAMQNTLSHQGFVIDQTSQFLGVLNNGDHLQLQLIDTTGKWENSWNTLSQIESTIGETLDFAYSAKFGFLTSDPTLCGTGLIIQAYLHLPALIHLKQLDEVLVKQKEDGVAALGISGNLEEAIGDLIVVTNTYTLGVSEENILHSVHSMAMKLMAMENTLRSHVQSENDADIKDQIARAYGLLLHSYQLQTKEALNALSLMKLGVQLGWIDGITDTKLNSLFFQCRRGHLLHHLNLPQQTDVQDIGKMRANFLHRNMQKVTLKFEAAS